jgi:hypothetical protein
MRWATCSPNVVFPAAGVADARKLSERWAKTAAAAARCHARSGRPAGLREFGMGDGTRRRRVPNAPVGKAKKSPTLTG